MNRFKQLANEAFAMFVLILALAFVLSLLSGCASRPPRLGDVAPVGSTMIVFVQPDEFDRDERWEVAEAAREIEAAWEGDFGRELPVVWLHVLSVDEFECNGTMAIGCTRRVDGTVHVIRGAENELPSYYHELCHKARASRFHGVDGRHEDPAWTSWTERGFRVSEKIAERR